MSADLKMVNEYWPWSRLKPYPGNARKHPKEQITSLADSMREFGQTTPIIVDEHGTIIAGHGRWEACKRAKVGKVWVAIAKGMSADQVAKYRLLDNALGDMSDWDMDAFTKEIAKLGTVDLGGFEFDFGLGLDDDERSTRGNNAATKSSGDAEASGGTGAAESEDDEEGGESDDAGGDKNKASAPIRVPIMVQLSPAQNKAWNALKQAGNYPDNLTAFLAITGIQ